MSTHNICFYGDIGEIFCEYPLLFGAMLYLSLHYIAPNKRGYPQKISQSAHPCHHQLSQSAVWIGKDPGFLQLDGKDCSDCGCVGWSESFLGLTWLKIHYVMLLFWFSTRRKVLLIMFLTTETFKLFNRYRSLCKFSRWQVMLFSYFSWKIGFDISYKFKKNFSKCCLLKILPLVLSVYACLR